MKILFLITYSATKHGKKYTMYVAARDGIEAKEKFELTLPDVSDYLIKRIDTVLVWNNYIMSHRPKAIQNLRPDMLAEICAWCADKEAADQWAEERGYDTTHGICPECLKKYKADSLKNTHWALR